MTQAALKIDSSKRVTLHFTVSLMDGSVVDSTKERDPATFTMGDGSLLPGFEEALQGLSIGDKRSVFLQPEQAFGPYNEKNLQHMPRERFEGMELAPGLMLSFADPGGGELPGVVKSFTDTTVTMDFNHPLAGRDITFDVEIINVVEASAQAVQLQSVPKVGDDDGR